MITAMVLMGCCIALLAGALVTLAWKFETLRYRVDDIEGPKQEGDRLWLLN